MKQILIYQPKKYYGTDFSNAVWAQMLNCSIAEPILTNGNSFGSYMTSLWKEKYGKGKGPHLIGSYYKGKVLNMEYTTSIKILNEHSLINDDISNFDIIFIAGFWFYYDYVTFLKRKFPNKVIVGIEEDTFDDMLFYDEELQIKSINALKSFDLFLAYDQPTFRFVSSLNQNCYLFSLPLNPSYLKGSSHRSKSYDKICLGVSHFVADLSNLITGILAYKEVKKNISIILEPDIIGVYNFKEKEIKEFRKIVPTLSIKGWISNNFPEFISRYILLLQPTLRRSFGRLSAECAISGVPCISNGECYMQKYCWPELCIEPFDLQQIILLAEKLLEDESFYSQVVTHARIQIEKYADRWDNFKMQLNKLIRAK